MEENFDKQNLDMDLKYVNPVFCSHCFTTMDEFVNTSFVGCPNCYKVFSKQIESYIKSTQFSAHHVGKLYLKQNEMTLEEKIAFYEKKLKLAIKEERFEDCAVIKHKIIALKEKYHE